MTNGVVPLSSLLFSAEGKTDLTLPYSAPADEESAIVVASLLLSVRRERERREVAWSARTSCREVNVCTNLRLGDNIVGIEAYTASWGYRVQAKEGADSIRMISVRMRQEKLTLRCWRLLGPQKEAGKQPPGSWEATTSRASDLDKLCLAQFSKGGKSRLR